MKRFLSTLVCILMMLFVTTSSLAWPALGKITAWVIWPVASFENKTTQEGIVLGRPIVMRDDPTHRWVTAQFAVCEGRPKCISEVAPIEPYWTACYRAARFRSELRGKSWEYEWSFRTSEERAEDARKELETEQTKFVAHESSAFQPRSGGNFHEARKVTFMGWLMQPSCFTSPI